MNRSLIKKIAAFSVSLAVVSGSFYYIPVTQVTTFSPVHAEQTVDELEQMKEENKKRIEMLQDEIDSAKEKYDTIVTDEKLKSDYKEALNEKMALQNQNIDYVASQIDRLDEQISENVDKINILEDEIKQNDEDIQENLSLLKQRVRASYMSGSDNLSSVLTGSSSFFDMLAKFELVSRVAEHDDNLVKTLKSQIEELKDLQATLRSQQNVLEENLASEQERKKEFTAALDLLAEDYMNTQKELERISGEKAEISLSIEEKEAAVAEQEEELKKIAEDIEQIQQMLIQQSVSVSVSQSVSASVSASVAASEAVSRSEEESRKAEESKKAESVKETQPAVSQAPVQDTKPETQPPVTQPPAPAVPETSAPAANPPSGISSSGFAWPVPGYGRITSGWGPRSIDNHKGVDITASDGGTILGKEIVASADGIVASVSNTCTHNYGKSSSCGCGGGYGRYVVILHSDGTYATLYAHMSSVTVSPKQSVTQGQVIGYAGSTGWSTGPHLHYEVHTIPFSYDRSNTLDPEKFISSP